MINLVVALKAEAAPLIESLGLKRDGAPLPFELWRNDDLQLVVCGMGALRAAGAVGWLAGQPSDSSQAWLNVGIAGHSTCSRGTLLVATKLIHRTSARCAYPPLIAAVAAKAENFDQLHTVDAPDTDYRQAGAVDMEAFGIWEVATRVSPAELVMFAKIVSDGPNAGSIEDIDRAGVSALVAEHVGAIGGFIDSLADLTRVESQRRFIPPEVEQITSRWHFSVSARHELSTLVRAWCARNPDKVLLDASFDSAKGAREVLDLIADRVSASSLGIDGRMP